ncbi:hypothetical protein LTR37_020157 [Vermiconidia calcicola]|uniref:Uncharacterized protein n=1 Tax=Vermiconidia calcicola TaxID=1690605 RepID=A0ACC3MC27_9PEZI|nr:hypothetical protein LTR37_020157 [Vermiconidia calcicola]
MEVPRQNKPRVSKACDVCHRKKTKCHWRPPSCADCIRLGTRCTFSRYEQDTSSGGNGVLKNDRPGRQANCQSPALRSPQEGEQLRSSALLVTNNVSVRRLDILHALEGKDIQFEIQRYFIQVNHYFPLFSRERFNNYLTDSFGPSLDDTSLSSACISAMLACLYQNQRMSGSGQESSSGDTAAVERLLEHALSVAKHVIVGIPTLPGIQLLATIAVNLAGEQSRGGIAANLLVAAIRMAFSLRLHRLDEATDISVAERLEKIRVFWCLYILDVELAMRNNAPAFIQDDDILVIEPQKISSDRCGLLASNLDDGKMLNLFAARQRLARAASKIWKELHTFRGQHGPQSERTEAVVRLNSLLASWKSGWFDYGPATELAQRWPKASLVYLVELQYSFFLCLLKANPHVPCDAMEVLQLLRDNVRPTDISPHCLQCARDTLCLATVLPQGGTTQGDVVQYTIPAMVWLLAKAAKANSLERQASDVSVVDTRLDDTEKCIEKGCNGVLDAAARACRELCNLVIYSEESNDR